LFASETFNLLHLEAPFASENLVTGNSCIVRAGTSKVCVILRILIATRMPWPFPNLVPYGILQQIACDAFESGTIFGSVFRGFFRLKIKLLLVLSALNVSLDFHAIGVKSPKI
jgi:hypothetical protein